MIVVYTLIALVALVYLWFKKRFSFWEDRNFPSVPGKIPFGSIEGMGYTAHSSDLFKKFYDEHKEKAPAFGIYFGFQPVLIPTDPELVKDILSRSFESFHDRGFYVNKKDDPISGHLVIIRIKFDTKETNFHSQVLGRRSSMERHEIEAQPNVHQWENQDDV
jgi:cytochrome P450 family 6